MGKYREKLDLHAERLIYREKESLYAERNGYYPYCNNAKKIVLPAYIYIFSSYILFVDASLTIHAQVSTFASFILQNYRVVGRPSYKMNIRPPFPPVIRTWPPIIIDWVVKECVLAVKERVLAVKK